MRTGQAPHQFASWRPMQRQYYGQLPPSGSTSRGRVPPCHEDRPGQELRRAGRSEEHTSELQSLMRISYAVFCLKKKNIHIHLSLIYHYITTYNMYLDHI